MATKIKIISAKEFLEVTPEGIINITTSRKLLIDIAKAEQNSEDHELLVDFRDTESNLSLSDIYRLAAELVQHGSTFRKKVALLVIPGTGFDKAIFFESCSRNRGFLINAFMDYETAVHWILSTEEPQIG
jgi:hypothetical protein